jgi:hypothetical protein
VFFGGGACAAWPVVKAPPKKNKKDPVASSLGCWPLSFIFLFSCNDKKRRWSCNDKPQVTRAVYRQKKEVIKQKPHAASKAICFPRGAAKRRRPARHRAPGGRQYWGYAAAGAIPQPRGAAAATGVTPPPCLVCLLGTWHHHLLMPIDQALDRSKVGAACSADACNAERDKQPLSICLI